MEARDTSAYARCITSIHQKASTMKRHSAGKETASTELNPGTGRENNPHYKRGENQPSCRQCSCDCKGNWRRCSQHCNKGSAACGDKSAGGDLEKIHVRRVYDSIGPHIADIKHKKWPTVKTFLKQLHRGACVADVGCGNGSYLQINPSIIKIGIDVCTPVLQSAASKRFEVLCADNLSLPFRDSCFDAAISIGVVHHFSSEERRVQALRELIRILRKEGQLLVYVWAFEQKYRKFDSQDILVPWHKPTNSGKLHNKHPLLASLSDADGQSISSTGSSFSDDDGLLPISCDFRSQSYHQLQEQSSLGSNPCHQPLPYSMLKTESEIGQLCHPDHSRTQTHFMANSYIAAANKCSASLEDSMSVKKLYSVVSDHLVSQSTALLHSFTSSLRVENSETLLSASKMHLPAVQRRGKHTQQSEPINQISTVQCPSSLVCLSDSLQIQQDSSYPGKRLNFPTLDGFSPVQDLMIQSTSNLCQAQLCATGSCDHFLACKSSIQSVPSTEDCSQIDDHRINRKVFRVKNGFHKPNSSNHCHHLCKKSANSKSHQMLNIHKSDMSACTSKIEESQSTDGSKRSTAHESHRFSVSQQSLEMIDRQKKSGVVQHSLHDTFLLDRICPTNDTNATNTAQRNAPTTVKSPMALLDMLRQRIRQVLTTQEKSRLLPAFIPCINRPTLGQQFQIREFPQSSMPNKKIRYQEQKHSEEGNELLEETAAERTIEFSNSNHKLNNIDSGNLVVIHPSAGSHQGLSISEASVNSDNQTLITCDLKHIHCNQLDCCFSDSHCTRENQSKSLKGGLNTAEIGDSLKTSLCSGLQYNYNSKSICDQPLHASLSYPLRNVRNDQSSSPARLKDLVMAHVLKQEAKNANNCIGSTDLSEFHSHLSNGKLEPPHHSYSLFARCKNDYQTDSALCRYYHVFREGELVDLILRFVPGIKIVNTFYDHANWGVILQKEH